MIIKENIDKYFSDNYENIKTIIIKLKKKYNPKAQWEIEELVTDTYFHLCDNVEKIETITNIEAFIVRYVNNQIKWFNSKINRLHRQDKIVYQDNINTQILDDKTDLDNKIEKEININNQKAILYDFYQQLPTKQEKILFEVIFYKNIKTIKELSKHFSINKNYIQIMKKTLFNDLKEYIKNNKHNYEN